MTCDCPIWYVGDAIRLDVTVFDVDGIPADPTVLGVTIHQPDGTSISGSPVRVSVGIYYFDYAVYAAGSYSYRWQSVGQNQAVAQGSFYVNPSNLS